MFIDGTELSEHEVFVSLDIATSHFTLGLGERKSKRVKQTQVFSSVFICSFQNIGIIYISKFLKAHMDLKTKLPNKTQHFASNCLYLLQAVPLN